MVSSLDARYNRSYFCQDIFKRKKENSFSRILPVMINDFGRNYTL